jgi:hypothetical protein
LALNNAVVTSLAEPEQSEPLEDIAAWLSSDVAGDPLLFVQQAFAWGEGELSNSSGPEPWQVEILAEIRDGLPLGRAIQIAVASGHGVGKTALIAWLVLWAISTFPDTRGIVTAATEPMLITRVRAELRKWLRLFKARTFFELGATSITSADAAHAQTWRIDLLAWSENRPEAFAGLHNAGRRIIVLYDEASAIADVIWETTEGALTDADTEIIWIAFGNPLRPVGRFRQCFEDGSGRWITKRVDSRTVSFTNQEQIKSWIASYGEDSDFVRTRIKGEFPRTASTQFIGPEIVDEAVRRQLSPTNDPLVIGVDVARFGSDSSVIYPRRGTDARSILPLEFRNIPLDQLEDQVISFCNQHRVDYVFVDGTGIGGGLVDHLRRRGLNVIDVQFASRPDMTIDGVKWANKRAEIWGHMRAALSYLCLPNNGELRQQLTGPEYSYNQQGAILLEAKDLMKRRGLPSPDLADALACTFASPMLAMRAAPEWQHDNRPGEYDPFSKEVMEGSLTATRSYVRGYPRLREEF